MPLAASDFELLRRLLRERAGIILTERDLGLVASRLAPVAKANGLASIELLVARLRAQSPVGLQEQAVEAMAAPSTPFLVDGRVGTFLTDRILPQLIRRRQQARRLRFWCPAAGAGQEPYSIALAIRERFPELAEWDISILASDATPAQIERGVAASYSQVEVSQGLPTPVLLKRFARVDGRWRLKDEIRSLVRFAEIDLRATWPELETMDAIFMRNVLVYFGTTVRRPLLARLRTVLAGDGYLFLGSADADALMDQRFTRMQDEKSGFYQPLG
jgi:chemotaxis protein methyltransferase CheR